MLVLHQRSPEVIEVGLCQRLKVRVYATVPKFGGDPADLTDAVFSDDLFQVDYPRRGHFARDREPPDEALFVAFEIVRSGSMGTMS